MPWQERSAERLRMEFVVAHESQQYSFTELCELFGISREAGYKCVRRFREDGIEGLKDRSRAPKTCPHRVDSVVEQLLIEARRKHPTWGPKSKCVEQAACFGLVHLGLESSCECFP